MSQGPTPLPNPPPLVTEAARGLASSVRGGEAGFGSLPLSLVGVTVVSVDDIFPEASITVHGDESTVLDGIPVFTEWYTPRVGDLAWAFKIGTNPAQFVLLGSDFHQSIGTSAGARPMAYVTSDEDLGVASSSDPLPGTQLFFDHVHRDNDDMFPGSGPWAGPTLNRDGIWLVEGQVIWNDANTVPVDRELRLYQTDADPPVIFYADRDVKQYETGTGTHFQTQRVVAVTIMGKGQTPSMWVWQGGTGGLSVLNDGNDSPRMSVTWLGEG